ncbi:hypothetical protein ACFTS5_00050 [Nocardia sp. NPDC056952]|uniref:hypothetical protein n=1 Tax=Nocardia sp. NPDC056952 TaxID=3345979 RepID=UPI003625A127
MSPPTITTLNSLDEIGESLRRTTLTLGRPVLVLVGGAAGLPVDTDSPLARLLVEHVVPLVEQLGAVVVDGGTDAGVMRMVGDARRAADATFRLVGVVAEGTVRLPGAPPPRSPDWAHVEPGHTDIVLVPGSQWGDESPWLAAVATAIAGRAGSVTMLVNGGAIAYVDVRNSLAVGRAAVVLAGSGRTADEIADARLTGTNERALAIADSPLTTVVSIADPVAVAAALRARIVESAERE